MTQGRIFLVEDDELILSMLSRALKKEGYAVSAETGTDDIIRKIELNSPNVVLLDIRLPGRSGIDILQEIKSRELACQVIMLTADDTAETAIKAMKLGAADYLTKPFNLDEVKIVIQNLLEKEQLKQELAYLRKINSEMFECEIIGVSEAMRELKEKARKLAAAKVSTVLITGESGTGKEMLSRYIHNMMHLQAGAVYAPFIAVNCAALPDHLIESELFGHQKGAFTDAKADKKGMFELANRGSILLDEVGDMKIDLQGKLLRVLEERMVRRVGGNEDLPIDVTVFATTNKNLEASVAGSNFRNDLFYRLNAFSFEMPSLRSRPEDVIPLARHFLAKFIEKYRKTSIEGFSPEAERLMTKYQWPGNIRELKNVVERTVVLEGGQWITPEQLPKELIWHGKPSSEPAASGFVLPEAGVSFDELEKSLILQALQRTHYNRVHAAKLLDMTYDALRYKAKKYGLE